MCPHSAIYVSSYCYICVLMLLYVSSYFYTCVLIEALESWAQAMVLVRTQAKIDIYTRVNDASCTGIPISLV